MADQPTPRSPPPATRPADPAAAPPPSPTTVPHADAGDRTHPPPAGSAVRSGLAPGHLPVTFGRYRLERLLGKGGMGAVYLAHDTQLDRRVALKVPSFGPDDGSLRERFFREARAAATLNHPNLCPVFDAGEHDGVCYLTMAYIEGKPLTEYVNPDRPMAPHLAATLVRVLAKALQEAHDHGIIHRDLKPANVMIGRKRQPVVMDFGLARRASGADERLTHSGAVMGTPAYMPPEQVNGDVAAMGPGCDVYSLGVILYELLTGRRPFDGPMGVLMAQIVMTPPPPPTELRPDLDPALSVICLKALAKSPQNRHPSMRAFAAALDGWLAGKSAPPPPADPGPPAPPPLPLAAPAPPPSSRPRRPAADEDDGDVEDRAAPRPRRPAPRKTKSRTDWTKILTRNQWWFLIVGAVVFFACVVPVGLVAFMVYGAVHTISDTASQFGKMAQNIQEDEKRRREEQQAEQRQWEEMARTWRPPPAESGLPFAPSPVFPATVGQYQLATTDARADVPELNVRAPGQRAVYRGPAGEVEVYVYRVSQLEKEAILQYASEAASRQATPDQMMSGPNVRGSAKEVYLAYDVGVGRGKRAQHGTFWWGAPPPGPGSDKGWLFLARGGSAKVPGAFLKEYLTAISRGNPLP